MEKRQYKRVRLDMVELGGTMMIIDPVEIVNISFGGALIRTAYQLKVGRDYLMTLVADGSRTELRCNAVHSGRTAHEEKTGTKAAAYSSGIKFKNGQDDLIANFLKSLASKNVLQETAAPDQRLSVRFRITLPLDIALSNPARFNVKTISLSGMLIRSDRALEIDSLLPMGLSLSPDIWINFDGRIVSCNAMDVSRELYEIGVAFTGLHDKNRSQLKTFINNVMETP
ncbi:MAG: PilZ domain-containing protein [Nitrospirae bacterium]|nr:PilZ domain-containing protein [Nitrospirota bacterium]